MWVLLIVSVTSGSLPTAVLCPFNYRPLSTTVLFPSYDSLIGRTGINDVKISRALGMKFMQASDQESSRDKQESPPLSLDQLKELVPILPDSAMAGEIRDRGINFTSTEEVIKALKEMGAGPQTIEALRSRIPNRPPTVVLSVNRTEIKQGESIVLFADANDPDGDEIQYDWSATDGTIEGEGRVVTFKTSGVTMNSNAARVTVSITVTDGRGGTHSDSKTLIVRSGSETQSGLATSITTWQDGKYFVVSLAGSSGGAVDPTGSINVELSLTDNANGVRRVTGFLPGLPCKVDFVPLENVAEYSFKEPPGIRNHWARVSVRVRLRDLRRTIRFQVTWRLIQSPPGSKASKITGNQEDGI
jgi:hypothetical protein